MLFSKESLTYGHFGEEHKSGRSVFAGHEQFSVEEQFAAEVPCRTKYHLLVTAPNALSSATIRFREQKEFDLKIFYKR